MTKPVSIRIYYSVQNQDNWTMDQYDLIIVGSGSVGSAAGYYSTLKGLKVLMIDQGHPPHDIGSHHGTTRLIRHAYGEGESYVPLVLKAQKLWNELQLKSDKKIFEKTGVLAIGPNDSKFLENMKLSSAKWNLGVQSFKAEDLMDRWPQIKVPQDFIGLLEENAGVLYSENAIESFVALSKQAGAVQLFGCTVTAVFSLKTEVAVETSQGRFTGKKMLVSAGTWAQKLIPHLPIKPMRTVVAWFEANEAYTAKNGFPGFTGELRDGSLYYGFPGENGELKIGRHDAGLPISSQAERVPFGDISGDKAEAVPFLKECLPGVGACVRGASCTYDLSPDEDFIIDIVDEDKHILVITGLSGHGFKFSSVIGEIASCFALGVDYGFDLKQFSLKRFS